MKEDSLDFRDKIATVDESGKRIWVFPKKPSGWFYNKRKLLSYFFLAFLFAGPFLTIGGQPLLLINVLERKFIILGQIFWPQDMPIFALGMIIMVVFVILFTVVFGRLFCGWVCPQTIFMEMVFRRIEYWIEGDWTHQKKLDKQPWNAEKIRKKTLKHILFFFISFFIANTFLSYIIGYKALWNIILDNPFDHLGGLAAIIIFTSLFYSVFAFMREQVCTTICPYGRLQGVLLDDKSLTVAYDHVRGEDRGKFKKTEDRNESGKGDCIDCGQCVDVCPTGIDIRNGTQLECVNCTACMDACDFMMENVGLKKGLIRLDSEKGIQEKQGFKFTARVLSYCAVLVILVGVMTGMIISRSDFQVTILRTRGTIFTKMDDNHYSNVYDITLLNKTTEEFPVELKLLNSEGKIEQIGNQLLLLPQAELQSKFMIILPIENINGRSTELEIGVYSNGKLLDTPSTKFIGPLI